MKSGEWMNKRIHIIVGHYGSGKTEFAINYAIKLKESYEKVMIADLDIVNPYFRTNDVKEMLEKEGISVLASQYAGSNVDIPALPANIHSLFDNKNAAVVLDVGGDEDGAVVLGRFKQQIEAEGYEMLFVVNTFRPLTNDSDSILQVLGEVEDASRLKVTGIVNNSNLQHLTKTEDVIKGQNEIDKAAKKHGSAVSYISGLPEVLDGLDEKSKEKAFPIKRYLDLGYQF